MAGFHKTGDEVSLGTLTSTDETGVIGVSDGFGFSVMLSPDGTAAGDIVLYGGIDADGSIQALLHTETVAASTPVILSVDMNPPLKHFKVVADLSAGGVDASYTVRR